MKKIILDETTQKELILAGLAQSQLLADVIDRIGPNPMFPQKLRNLCKRLAIELENVSSCIYLPQVQEENRIEEHEEMQLYDLCKLWRQNISKIVYASRETREKIAEILDK